MALAFKHPVSGQLLVGATKATTKAITASGVSNQTANFGALTLAGAGGYKPVRADSTTADISTFDSLVSGSLGSFTVTITNNALTFTGGGAGAPDLAVLRCTLVVGGTIDITINQVAGQYHVRTNGEGISAFSDMGSAGGKTIMGRQNGYGKITLWGRNVTFASQVLVDAEGDPFTLNGARAAQLQFDNCDNLRVTNWEAAHSVAAGGGVAVNFKNSCNDIQVDGNYIHGDTDVNPLSNISAGDLGCTNGIKFTGGSNITVKENLIEFCETLISIGSNVSGDTYFFDNQLQFWSKDAFTNAHEDLTGDKHYFRNVMAFPIKQAGAHSDGIQLTSIGSVSTDEFLNLIIRQNVFLINATVSSGELQGITCFRDSTTFGRQFKDPIICGNVYCVGTHIHAITMSNLNGGLICNNTMVGSTSSPTSTATIRLGIQKSVGTITVRDNAADAFNLAGSATYVTSNNITLGQGGVTIDYGTAFVNPVPANEAANYAEILTKWAMKVDGPLDFGASGPSQGDSSALGTGYGVYGNPRSIGGAGWSFDSAYEA